MIARISLLLALLTSAPMLAGSIGCSADPRTRVALDQMGAELTAVEDRYYELEYKYELARQELEACRATNSGVAISSGQDCEVPSSVVGGEVVSGEYIDASTGNYNDYEEISPGSSTPNHSTPTIDMGIPDDYELQAAALDLGPVTSVMLEPRGTGGFDSDDDQIDDGIVLTILPRDANGNTVDQIGDIMISLIDSTQVGEEQRVGLWQLKRDEVAALAEQHQTSEGFRIDLPWERSKPISSQLTLYIRYENDEQRLETSMDIAVNVPGSIVRKTSAPIQIVRQAQTRIAAAPSTSPANAFVSPQKKAEDLEANEIEWKPTRD